MKVKMFEKPESGINSKSNLVGSSKVLDISSIRLETDWVLDSSCTFHMTSFRHWSSDLKEIEGSRVLLGDDHEYQINDIDSVKLSLLDGTIRILNCVRFMLELKRNLIPLSTLDAIKYSVNISDGIMK